MFQWSIHIATINFYIADNKLSGNLFFISLKSGGNILSIPTGHCLVVAKNLSGKEEVKQMLAISIFSATTSCAL